MKKTLIGAAAVALGVTGALAFVASPAQAAVDCATPTTYKAKVTDWPDRGAAPSYAIWAKKNMTRAFLVCSTGEAENGTVTYKATVTDAGMFVTQGGTATPAGKTGPLAAGITGKVNGGFSVTFTGPEALTFKTPTLPASGYLENNDWVAAAFTDATLLTFTNYKWTYTTACESFRDDNDNYYGDITSKCAKPAAVTQADVKDATCKADGVLTLPTVDGVVYSRDPAGGTGTVNVKAVAADGYKLTKGNRKWTVTVPAKLPATHDDCKQSPSPSPSISSPTPTKSATVAPVTPSESESTPAQAGLPVTGPGGGTNVPLVSGLAGGALLAFGIALYAWAKRRRDNEVEFTA